MPRPRKRPADDPLVPSEYQSATSTRKPRAKRVKAETGPDLNGGQLEDIRHDHTRPRSKRTKSKKDHADVEFHDLGSSELKNPTPSAPPYNPRKPRVKKEPDEPEPSMKVQRRQRDKHNTVTGVRVNAIEENPPPLKKEDSMSASVALSRIAELVHAAISESDLSSDEDTSTSRATDDRRHVNKRSTKPEPGDDDDDDDLFEDVDLTTKGLASSKFDIDADMVKEEDLSLTLEKAERIQLAKTGKKKQSARAVHERAFCHYMSTIAMVALGAWRNLWISDGRVHRILRTHMKRHAAGLDMELVSQAKNKTCNSLELIELLGRTMRVFKSHFKRTKPGLRKLGHRPVSQMDAGNDIEQAAEDFQNLDDFVAQARLLEGSRDFGAQLFTALLRSYHFKVRLVFSAQPLGFKFNERETFNPDLVVQVKAQAEKRAAMTTDRSSKAQSNVPGKVKNTGTKDDAISLQSSDLSELESEYSIDLDLLSNAEVPVKNSNESSNLPDNELEFPIFWTEIYDFGKERWIAVDAMVKTAVFVEEKDFKTLHPRGHKAEQQKLTLGFVIAYDANKYAKDVTMRYASSWAKVKEVFLRADGKTNTRYDVNKILVRMGNPHRDASERREDDSLAFKEVKKIPVTEMPKTLADFKSSPIYILDKHLREKDAFKPDAKPVDTFSVGKGAKATTSKVFLRKDVVSGKTIENYHKEGRRIKADERPIKMIKARAMTTNRIREHQQQLAETGEEHVMQGIYAIDQTEYIIPPPIRDGIIPKNSYGNADVFVESMVPVGATHLKLKGVARIARKLEIEHAEAVVGFEFKARGAIPVVLGVLVADEHAARLEAAWREAEEIRVRKEDRKRSEAALKLWARLLKGMRIRSRINAEYGIPPTQLEGESTGTMFVPEPEAPKTLPLRAAGAVTDTEQTDEQEDGGFIRE